MYILTVRAVHGGSEGWVLFEVNVGNRVEQFRLDFADPASWLSKNYLRKWSSNDNRLNVEVRDYKKEDHPFYGMSILIIPVIVFI